MEETKIHLLESGDLELGYCTVAANIGEHLDLAQNSWQEVLL